MPTAHACVQHALDVPGAATLPLVDTWRCPHCGTTQADAPRCWACSRYPIACGSCRNFRRSVAGRLGYCGLDRTRASLEGDEVRICWESPLRPEPFEGLFLELTPDPEPMAATPSAAETRSSDGAVGTPGRPVPSVRDANGRSAQGLVEARYVPARAIASDTDRRMITSPGLLDLEMHHLGGRSTAARQDGPGGDETLAAGGPLAGELDP